MIPDNKDFRNIRFTLLIQSLTVSILIEKIRKVLNIPQAGLPLRNPDLDSIICEKREWLWKQFPDKVQKQYKRYLLYYENQEADVLAVEQVAKEELYFIYVIADKLNTDRLSFERYVLFNISLPLSLHGIRIIVQGKTLDEPGVYLKLDPYTTASELQNIYKQLDRFLQKTSAPVIHKTKKRKKSTATDIQKEINQYGVMESRIKEHHSLMKHTSQEKQRADAYENIISDALKELAGEDIPDNLSSLKWNLEMNKQAKKLKNVYYDITSRYNLPTLRDLPHFLPLIPNN